MKFASSIITALALAAVLGAQSQPSQPQNPQKPTFKTGINFVYVDVYPRAGDRAVNDLKRDDFEILEDDVPQRIETFEQVIANAAAPEAERAEPRTLAESNDAAADPRNRLFVLFFDTLHSAGYEGTGRAPSPGMATASSGGYDPRVVGRALARFLDQLIGANDLVGIMRPEMSVEALSFTRRPSTFSEFLLSGAEWQQRFLSGELDDTERKYVVCYPPDDPTGEVSDVAWKMIRRRRELLMIDGLRALSAHLQNLREGRKAVVVISEGWTLFTPDTRLGRMLRHEMPGPRPPAVGPGGQPTIASDPRDGNVLRSECERDRLMLARVNDDQDFKQLLDEANRANVSFYPVDPRGLTPQSTFNRQSESLMTLATATDGIPLVGTSNDFAPGLKRINDDLSSYYVLGYTSSNSKFDGKFRSIAVRVKRPGVTVRARKGYLAATEAEAAERARVEAHAADPDAAVRDNALSMLGTERPDHPFRVAAGYAFEPPAAGSDGRRASLWVTGELDLAAARTMEWSGGGEATVVVTAAGGQALATERATISAGAPRFRLNLLPDIRPGSYLVRAELRSKSVTATDTAGQARVTVADVTAAGASGLGTPLLFRRGPYTGAGYQPTADLRFRKAERIRVDVPAGFAPQSTAARLLDRRGQPIAIPVTVGQREDGGRQFITAEITLAPLAPADYLVEVTARRGDRAEKTIAAFRIVP